MSRLTARNKAGRAYYPHCFDKCNGQYGNCSECKFELDYCEKLAHYEDLEEQGRLIEQKHGEWIPFKLDTRGYIEIMHYECSSCHEISDDATMSCPNCGAKMDEVGND